MHFFYICNSSDAYKSIYLCVGGNHFELEGKNIGLFDRKTSDINLSTPDHS